MTFSVSDIIALVLAFLGLVGTTSVLVMNLKVTAAIQTQEANTEKKFAALELQIERSRSETARDHAQVKLDIANLRTKLAEDQNTLLSSLMRDVQGTFMNRQVSEGMHAENTRRLDELAVRLDRIEEKINV